MGAIFLRPQKILRLKCNEYKLIGIYTSHNITTSNLLVYSNTYINAQLNYSGYKYTINIHCVYIKHYINITLYAYNKKNSTPSKQFIDAFENLWALSHSNHYIKHYNNVLLYHLIQFLRQ